MYAHIKPLARLGVTPTAVTATGQRALRGGGSAGRLQGGGGPGAGGLGAPTAPSIGGTTARTPDKGTRTTASVTTLGGHARVSGFASATPAPRPEHQHADAFQRRRGVVNTLGGARDVTRTRARSTGALPSPSAAPRAARIATFDTLDTTGAAGVARAANRAKRDAANAARGRFPQLGGTGVHVVKGGGRG